MNPTSDWLNRTLTLERTFNAPIQLVWDAWSQKVHIENWWSQRGATTKVETLDFRPGGKWKFVMAMPGGGDYVGEGEYLEIEAPHKIVFTASWKPMTEGVTITIFLEDLGKQTKFTFHVTHPTEEYCKQQNSMGVMNGWGGAFEGLRIYLEDL